MNAVHTHIIGGSPLFREGLLHVLTPIASQFSEISTHRTLETLRSSVASCKRLILSFLPSDRERCREFLSALSDFPGASVIVFGPVVTVKEVRRLIGTGISAYLLPTVSPADLRVAIAELLSGGTYVDPQLRRQWVDRQFSGARPGRSGRLTKREQEILQFIVREHTTDEIASLLFISRCTVETHRANILAKLGVKNTAGLVREAVVNKLCLV